MKYKIKKEFWTSNKSGSMRESTRYWVNGYNQFNENDYTEYYINWLIKDGYIEEVKEVEVNRFLHKKPKVEKIYWRLDGVTRLFDSVWRNDVWDNGRWSMGNCYSSEALATKARDQQLAKMELERLNKGFVPNWDNENQSKYYIQYNHSSKNIAVDWAVQFQESHIYFASQEDAREAIDALGEGKIKLALGIL